MRVVDGSGGVAGESRAGRQREEGNDRGSGETKRKGSDPIGFQTIRIRRTPRGRPPPRPASSRGLLGLFPSSSTGRALVAAFAGNHRSHRATSGRKNTARSLPGRLAPGLLLL